MPEVRKVSVITEKKNGRIVIADEVAAIIADLALTDVKGMILPGHKGSRNYGKGFAVRIEGNDICIDVTIMLRNGFKATTVSAQIQQKVKAALENMLDLNVKEVNVNILGIQREKTE